MNFILVSEFSHAHAKGFMDWLVLEKEYEPKTRNGYRVTIKMLFEKVVETGIIKDNPFDRIKKIKFSSVPALYFDEYQRKELKEYLTKNEPQLALFVQFIFYCFVRPGELRRLRIGDIHGNKLQIRGKIAKNTKLNMYLYLLH